MNISNLNQNITSFKYPTDPSLRSKSELEQNESSTEKSEPSSDDTHKQPTESEKRELQQLKNRDRDVRAHELAHISVGGRYVTSGASFSYEKGSDGRLYAVGGEVSIDTSHIPNDPVATLRKAQVVQRAALAPANPSAQDRRVAAQATAMQQQARIEIAMIAEENMEQTTGSELDVFI